MIQWNIYLFLSVLVLSRLFQYLSRTTANENVDYNQMQVFAFASIEIVSTFPWVS